MQCQRQRQRDEEQFRRNRPFARVQPRYNHYGGDISGIEAFNGQDQLDK